MTGVTFARVHTVVIFLRALNGFAIVSVEEHCGFTYVGQCGRQGRRSRPGRRFRQR